CVIFNSRPDLIVSNAEESVLFSNRMYLGQPDAYAVSIISDALGAICPGTPVTYTATPNDPDYENSSYQWTLNGQIIPEANQSTFTSSEIKNGDIISVRFSSDENKCAPITAGNPITMQVAEPIKNSLERIDGPNQPEVGQEATFRAIPLDNTINWTYRWTILYDTAPNPITETVETNTPTLEIKQVRADMVQIGVEQLAPDGSCVDALISPRVIIGDFFPLPIELLYFKAKKQTENLVMLEWATVMEKKNYGFEVQVSQDAINYRTLSFIPTQNGNSNVKQVYAFYDRENGKYGTRYYRLKQIDVDGVSAYFGPVAVKMNELKENILAYPNPFTTEVILEIHAPEAGKMHLVLYNSIGSKVMAQTIEIKKGNNKEVVSVNPNLPLGVYTLKTDMNGRSIYIKILKK
ncbi:MAG: T9SS type A sorting domain-containing protein, partial [Bacteroidota bacterium]|nr:T9SS type A sorting domain-containing protein [Bacteroidota bacterium]